MDEGRGNIGKAVSDRVAYVADLGLHYLRN